MKLICQIKRDRLEMGMREKVEEANINNESMW